MGNYAVFGVFTLVLCAVIVSAQKGKDMKDECKGEDAMSAMNEFYKVEDCLKEAGVEMVKDLTDDKHPCYTKCIHLKKNLVNEEGKIMKDSIGSSLSPSLPEAVKSKIQMAMEKCYDDNGPTMKIEDCQTFIPISQCIAKAFTDACKTMR